MKIIFETEELLLQHIDLLRQAGVKSILYRNIRDEILCGIVRDANPRELKFSSRKLPIFIGNFKQFKKDCILFFNELAKRKRDKSTAARQARFNAKK